VLAPCVAWLPPAFKAPKTTPATATAVPADPAAAPPADEAAAGATAAKIVDLEGDEAQAIVVVLEGLINKFDQIYG